MRIEDEDVISFTDDQLVQHTYTIKELVGLRETCSDEEYLNRYSICKQCDKCVGNEICTENGQLVRLYCRLIESECPLKKW